MLFGSQIAAEVAVKLVRREAVPAPANVGASAASWLTDGPVCSCVVCGTQAR